MDETRSSKSRRSKTKSAQNETIDELNVRYRVCHLFNEDKEKNAPHVNDNDKICKCGWPKSKHKLSLEDSEQEWTIPHNTLEQIDPEYGQTRNSSRYVRLAIDTSLEKVEKILLEAWTIPKPRFIVSIIGGAKYFKLSNRLETNFINGIVDIAQKSDAWLLTTGYKIGIVQLVGQAIRKVRLTKPKQVVTAIGIGKWGCIANIEYETGSKKQEMNGKKTDTPVYERKRRQSGEYELETNHSHYLMLDDGTVRNYEIEDYRTRLAIHLARLKHDDDITTPVVTIMVEGGKDTLANVYYDLRKNVPVLIINGSGRAADFLSRWLIITKDLESKPECRDIVFGINELKETDDKSKKRDDESKETDDESKRSNKKRGHNGSSNFGPSSTTTSKTFHIDYTRNGLEHMFEKYEGQITEDLENIIIKDPVDKNLIRQVMYCLQPAVRSDITIFNLNSDDDLSDTILKSICQSRQKLTKRKENDRNYMAEIDQQPSDKPDINEQKRQKLKSRFRIGQKDQKATRSRLLKLAIDWNCIDVAKEFIFKNSLNHIMGKNGIFQSALLKNLPKFVYEFLELNIDLCDIFLPKNNDALGGSQYDLFIQIMYNKEIVNHDKTHLKWFVGFDKATKKAEINSVEKLNNTLRKLIGDYMHKLYFDTLEEENNDRIKCGLQIKKQDLSDGQRKEIMRDYFMRDVFLWAILMNYSDMAKVLLSHMKYRICPALIATKIFKEYNHKAPYGDLKKSYDESATYFEQYAIDCLDKCDDNDVAKSCEIILQRNELYGYVTCLQVAADAGDELFIATPCCVEAMNNIWYDKLYPKQTKRDKLNLFFGFISLGLLAPNIVSYRTGEKNVQEIDRSKRMMRGNGINYGDPALLEYYKLPSMHPTYLYYFSRLAKFHQSLPVKFFYHLITYCFFLLLFSYVLLFNFSPPTNQSPSIHWTEILTIILVSCMLIEEIRYFFSQDYLTWDGRIGNYFGRSSKLMTVLGFILFYIGLILRFRNASSEDDFIAARVVMAIDLEIWWLRFLSFIIIIPLLGPHLVSIRIMLKDLLFFMCIIAIVMIGYGVASRSMVYYPVANGFTTATGGTIDTNFDGRSVFHQILYPVYYMMYGLIDNELAALNINPNAGWAIATYVLFSIHLILINILLVNMLIAIFSKRFDEVYDDIQNIWRSQQYTLIREYYTRAPFFPPISLIYDMYHLCRMFFFFIRQNVFDQSANYEAQVFQIIPEKESTIKDWCEFEENSTYEYAHNEVKILKNTSTKSTSQTDTKTKERQETIADIKDNTNNTVEGLKKTEDDLSNLNIIIDEMKKNYPEKNKKS